jgi:hypothetical protein
VKQRGYGKYVERAVDKVPYGTIVRSRTIAADMAKEFAIPLGQAMTLCNLKLKRLADHGVIVRLQKGAYCHFKQTAFGNLCPSKDDLATQILMRGDGRVTGYETGASALNKLGLVTLLPRNREIATNNYRVRLPEGCHVEARKPVTKISAKNWRYLQLIDAVDNLPRFPIDVEHPERQLRSFAERQNLDPLRLITMAHKYYSKKTTLRLVDLFAAS